MESECEKKTVESNARYFLSAIVSSSSKSVTKEEAMIKQERNKLNPSPEVSTMMVEYDSKSELPPRKRKNKKESFSVEKISMDNRNSSNCMAPCQSEEIIEPTRKKKKLKNKMKETHVEKTFTDNDAVSKCTAPCQFEEMSEPTRKKKKLKNKINGNLAEKKFIDNDADSVSRERDIAYCMAHCREVLQFPAQKISCTAPCQSEETIAPTHIKKTYKNDIGKILPRSILFFISIFCSFSR